MGWIRIRMDPELLPGFGTQKIQSWIRNISIRIRNTGNNTVNNSNNLATVGPITDCFQFHHFPKYGGANGTGERVATGALTGLHLLTNLT